MKASDSYPIEPGPSRLSASRTWDNSPDKWFGLVAVISGVLHVLVGGVVMALSRFFLSAAGNADEGAPMAHVSSLHPDRFPGILANISSSSFLGLAGLFLLVSILQGAGGVAMMWGRKWGMWAVLLTSLLFAAGSTGIAIWEDALFIYCLLRITGAIRPRETA